jgi:hypothetical protein
MVRILQRVMLVAFSLSILGLCWSVSAWPQSKEAGDGKYAGTWTGSYTGESGGGGDLSFILSKDDKAQWHGTLKFTNQDGEHKQEMKSLEIGGGKLKAKVELNDGQAVGTIEGQLKGDGLEGTFSITPTGSTDVAETGTWKLSRSTTPVTSR